MAEIEVFKTDVKYQKDADKLVREISNTLAYQANFDLDDCDNILRVKSASGNITTSKLIKLLSNLGFNAIVL